MTINSSEEFLSFKLALNTYRFNLAGRQNSSDNISDDMEVWSAKVFALVSLFVVVLVWGRFRIKLVSVVGGWRRQAAGPGKRSCAEMFIDALSCFGGGVFLATSLLHLLPDVRSAIESILKLKQQTISFPLAEFIACMGFFIVMFLEHLLMQCYRKQFSSHKEDPAVEQEARSMLPSSDGSTKNRYGTVSLAKGGTVENPANEVSKVKVSQNCRISVSSDVDLVAHAHVTEKDKKGDVHALRSLVFLLALSMHTIFEGLALGLQPSAQQVLALLAVVLVHKAIISFTVGIRFAESMHSIRRTVVALLVLSVTAPVGVAIGIAVTETGQQSLATDVTSAVLQGLATGTFLYVTFFEVLLDQMKDDHNVLKVLAVIVGFACITVLELF